MNVSSLVELQALTKSYGGVQALKNVTLNILHGEVHALCGENGAGKSTLIKLLTGVVKTDRGQILIDGKRLPGGRVSASENAGIAVIHQESTAFPDLNAVDNLFVGREITCCGGLLLDHRAMRRKTTALLQQLGAAVPIDRAIGELPPAQRQMVAMARALSRNCRLLIMDEPTAALSARETDRLLEIIRTLRSQGVSVLYVSHRLEEVFRIADRVTVLRDGEVVATHPVTNVDTQKLIRLMVGRELTESVRRTKERQTDQNVVLKVEHLSRRGVFQDVSFEVCSGEIVGLTGLVGSGRSEIVRAIFGIDRYDAGLVSVRGRRLPRGSVRQAVAAGVGMVPEDRQHEGLVLPMTVSENISLAVLPRLTGARRLTPGFVNRTREREVVATQMSDLDVRAASPRMTASALSGGNQQKLVIGKWLACRPSVMMLDEPTRGVDVGAKAQVHQLIRQQARNGLATLVISSELPELLSLCDRLLILRGGRIVAEVDPRVTTPEKVLALSLPQSAEVAVS